MKERASYELWMRDVKGAVQNVNARKTIRSEKKG